MSELRVTQPALAPGRGDMVTFSPWEYRLTSMIHDPLFVAIRNKWSDRQQIARTTYDTMYKHAAVSAPLDSLVSFLKSYRPMFKPGGNAPTDLQKQLADYMNEQLRRLGSSGDPRQGWSKFVEWIGQGLKYGFSLAEMETVHEPWNGQRRIQINRVIPLPQASLDNYYTTLEEYGQGIRPSIDIRYRCFQMDQKGRITSVRQYWRGGGSKDVDYTEWTGGDLLRILHYVHGGGEGNPFGQSLLFTAYYHWASLYTIEAMEEAFLDAGLPYLTASYKTKDGVPSPALHADFLSIITKQDPNVRALIMPDTTFGSVAPSNPSFTEHVKVKKEELRDYIRTAIVGMPVMGASTGRELDARNAIQVFFKYFIPALQSEVGNILTWQFGRRLIDANWSGLNDSDYPELVFENMLDNDIRVAMPLIQQILPFVDHTRLGEMMQTLVPGFDSDWIPADHQNSMKVQRGAPNPAEGQTGPPTKQDGSTATQHSGETGNLGGGTDTAV